MSRYLHVLNILLTPNAKQYVNHEITIENYDWFATIVKLSFLKWPSEFAFTRSALRCHIQIFNAYAIDKYFTKITELFFVGITLIVITKHIFRFIFLLN